MIRKYVRKFISLDSEDFKAGAAVSWREYYAHTLKVFAHLDTIIISAPRKLSGKLELADTATVMSYFDEFAEEKWRNMMRNNGWEDWQWHTESHTTAFRRPWTFDHFGERDFNKAVEIFQEMHPALNIDEE